MIRSSSLADRCFMALCAAGSLALVLGFAPSAPMRGASDGGDAMQRADRFFAARKYDDALTVYSALSRANPHNGTARRMAGECGVMLGEAAPKDKQLAAFKTAESVLRDAIRLNPRDGAAHYWLARCLGQEALFVGVWKSIPIGKEVKTHVDLAIQYDPSLDGAYHVRARWNREVTEKPKFARVPLGLGDADLKAGYKDIQEALELNPHHLNHHIEMARYQIRFKKLDEAREWLTRGLNDTQMDDPEKRPEAEALLATLNKGK